MKTTTLILSAIIVALPLSARSDYTYQIVNNPRKASNGDTVVISNSVTGMYLTEEPTVADETHIATTAYVKGAYNATIAAINTLRNRTQDRLQVYDENDDMDLVDPSVYYSFDDIGSSDQLISGLGIKNALNAQRIRIYTTWDTNDTTKVDLLNTWDADYDD